MDHNPNAHHFYVSKCIVSNIQLYVSNIKRMFPIYRLCFQTPFHVSNIQFLFPISNLCFQMKIMFPNDNVSNVCFQYTWSHVSNVYFQYTWSCLRLYQLVFLVNLILLKPGKIADTDMTNFEIADTDMKLFEIADTDADTDMKVF